MVSLHFLALVPERITLHSAWHKVPESMCEHFAHFQESHAATPLEARYDLQNVWEVLTLSCILDKMRQKESHSFFYTTCTNIHGHHLWITSPATT